MSESLCTCCDLPLYSCGKALEQQQRAERQARVQRALRGRGAVLAAFPGTCACGDRFEAGTPIERHPDGWVDLLEHPEGLDA